MGGRSWSSILVDAVSARMRAAVRSGTGPTRRRPAPSGTPNTVRTRAQRSTPPTESRTARDFSGRVQISYAPNPDGNADPGEVVWAWVPYDEDAGQGKDRPVLIIGVDGTALLALMLTSKDHDLDAADEARHGRYWHDIGSGDWDRRRRPSEVRIDRVLRLEASAVRREGARLDRGRFDAVAARVRQFHGW
jgi:hypothetical protein